MSIDSVSIIKGHLITLHVYGEDQNSLPLLLKALKLELSHVTKLLLVAVTLLLGGWSWIYFLPGSCSEMCLRD